MHWRAEGTLVAKVLRSCSPLHEPRHHVSSRLSVRVPAEYLPAIQSMSQWYFLVLDAMSPPGEHVI